jgi:hypothetical protein
LAEDYANEIEEFDLICFFCAQPFEEELVNHDCELNKTPKTELDSGKSSGSYYRSLRRNNTTRSENGMRKDSQRKDVDWEGFTEQKPANIYYGNRR